MTLKLKVSRSRVLYGAKLFILLSCFIETQMHHHLWNNDNLHSYAMCALLSARESCGCWLMQLNLENEHKFVIYFISYSAATISNFEHNCFLEIAYGYAGFHSTLVVFFCPGSNISIIGIHGEFIALVVPPCYCLLLEMKPCYTFSIC